MVILRNGQFVEGRITQTDGLYVVDLPDGQIRIKAADVDVVCRDLDEGYVRKRAAIQVGNVNSHLELAQWCLRHNLLGPAAQELADATAADPKNPMIDALQRRLKLALEPPAVEVASQPLSGPSNDELDRMIRGLPHGAVETFTQSVQPVLINHCATSGCHGPQSETGLRLLRSSAGQSAGRRITQRNLYSVLQFVNRDTPLASRLLVAPSGPHGNARYAVFSERQASQFTRLVEWTYQLAQTPASDSPPATIGPVVPVAAPQSESAPHALSQEARKARPLAAAEKNQVARRNGVRPAAKPPADAMPASFDQPVDPFDPEVFNRRFAPKKEQPESGSRPAPE